jgi:hypothetical protein
MSRLLAIEIITRRSTPSTVRLGRSLSLRVASNPPGRHRGGENQECATQLHGPVDSDWRTQTTHRGSRHQAAGLFVKGRPVRRNADTFRANDRRSSVLAGGEKYP